jgi:hypothetical protein
MQSHPEVPPEWLGTHPNGGRRSIGELGQQLNQQQQLSLATLVFSVVFNRLWVQLNCSKERHSQIGWGCCFDWHILTRPHELS